MTEIALEAPFYDEVMTATGARDLAPLDSSSSLTVYEAASKFVDYSLPVVELGCGTGRFAELLRRNGTPVYFGVDFAPAVVAEAERYCQGDGFFFATRDIRVWEHGPTLPDECCYVMLEVLEHLDDDLDVISRIPPGLKVVFSVPNFWAYAHVRRFSQPRDVFDRYGHLLDFDAWQSVAFPMMGRRIHVFSATVRAERL